jgi:hypothetical protein
MHPVSYLFLLFGGLYALAMSDFGLYRGRLVHKTAEINRDDDPVWFWCGVTLQFVIGVACLGLVLWQGWGED